MDLFIASLGVSQLQIQHPRCSLELFDMVITPIHDYHTMSPAARKEVPRAVIPWLTPQQPPNKNVVWFSTPVVVHFLSFCIDLLKNARLIFYDHMISCVMGHNFDVREMKAFVSFRVTLKHLLQYLPVNQSIMPGSLIIALDFRQ
jgi:hypothetical protein